MNNVKRITHIEEAEGSKATTEIVSGTIKSSEVFAALKQVFKGVTVGDSILVNGNGGQLVFSTAQPTYDVTITKHQVG